MRSDPGVATRHSPPATARAGMSDVRPDHPIFAGIAPYTRWLEAGDGACAKLNEALDDPTLRFVAQSSDLFGDGLHYEERIARRGLIATREHSTHDLFNAMIWLGHTALKRAMNARQVADISRVGPKQRTRGQCALTHFDEAGAIVWLDRRAWLDAWDAHDWPRLFVQHGHAWGQRIAVTVIGHALLDYALMHDEMPVAKALAVIVDRDEIVSRSHAAQIASWPSAEQALARAIASGRCLTDPQELRPLPLAGIPGWHAGEQSESFFATAPCFRPLRPGRRYPEPLAFVSAGHADACERALDPAAIG